jgi:beta-aspartyl-peptidase (threonine type)
MLLAAALSCTTTIFAAAGTYARSRLTGHPALVLSGGGLSQMPRQPVMRLIRSNVAAPAAALAGNLLILKASGARDYSDDFYRDSRLASVREILIPPCAPRAQVDKAAPYVDAADAVLFAGGDQAHYVAWKGSKLIAAVKRLYARGGVEGGGSAGLAIQGAFVYDSVAADRLLPDDEEVHTRDAIANPFEPAISFTTNFFAWRPLANTITDTHFARRDRFGRLTAFMARITHARLPGSAPLYGLGVDEGVVLLVSEDGWATLYQRDKMESGYVPRGIWILSSGKALQLQRGRPLMYDVQVFHVRGNGTRFNLLDKAAELRYDVRVNGTKPSAPYHPRDPYSP